MRREYTERESLSAGSGSREMFSPSRMKQEYRAREIAPVPPWLVDRARCARGPSGACRPRRHRALRHEVVVMRAPRVLDLYCGAGCLGDGYAQAGFEVTGVDIKPQPRNPYPVAVMNALALPAEVLRGFDLIHASPPCQGYTDMRAPGRKDDHPRLIEPTLTLLRRSGVPFVIENVESDVARKALGDPFTLCGSMFDLRVNNFHLQRHRLFVTSFPVLTPTCQHKAPVIGVYGGHVRCRAAAHGGRRSRDFEGFDKRALAHKAMGMDRRVTMTELSEAIPPAYTRWIAQEFLRVSWPT